MAVVRIPDEERTLREFGEIKAFLASINIGFENWKTENPVKGSSSTEEILEAYAKEIEVLKASGGYVTADVIDVKPDTPNLDVMLAKFSREHWHDEDEVRFIIEGHGIFHLRPQDGPVVAVEVEAGDLMRVPAGTWHWFDLCGDRRIRAIRLFQDPTGWTPHYTESGVDKGYLPVCFGLTFIPAELQKY
ncbi:MAG: cupin domain-containing protein [bacterium]|nr:cupin domain-containing protein [bacterium]